MRLYYDHPEHYIHALAAAITRDPMSLAQWKCLHITPLGDEVPTKEALEALKKNQPNADCDVILCPDHELLLISKSLGFEIMHTLGASLAADFEAEPEAVYYDLFRDWLSIREILLNKTDTTNMPDIALTTPNYNFGELESLKEVFTEARNRRASRQPQHVMIVEDDPVTRRIVASGFKHDYAIISAENAEQAVSNYLLHAPDVVFLDIGLPDASGLDVLRQLVSLDPSAYIIMFSGNSYLDNVTTALQEGARGFIAKPFKRDTMQHYIDNSATHHRHHA